MEKKDDVKKIKWHVSLEQLGGFSQNLESEVPKVYTVKFVYFCPGSFGISFFL